MIQLPKDVTTIINTLNKSGFEAYIVGGCVRDFLLGQTPKDFDVATKATPEDVKKCFRKTVNTGIAHGTVTVVLNGLGYEVTTYRIDGAYEDGRHPEKVFFTKSLIEDLERRDFTMNAVAYHPDVGFVDPFGGMGDIEKKIIKGVGDPQKRLQEDALRMLRAVRFSCALGFCVEEKTYRAIRQNAPLLSKISKERVRDEFIKICMSTYRQNINLLYGTGLLPFIFPKHASMLQQNKTTIIKEVIRAPQDATSAIAVFLRHIDDDELPGLLRELRFDNKSIKEIAILAVEMKNKMEPNDYDIRKKISQIGFSLFEKLLTIQKLAGNDITPYQMVYDHIVEKNQCIFLKDLSISGDDLLQLGLQGKEVGERLQYLLDYVHRYPEKNDKECLLQKARDLT